jgi:hypothetical protein
MFLHFFEFLRSTYEEGGIENVVNDASFTILKNVSSDNENYRQSENKLHFTPENDV